MSEFEEQVLKGLQSCSINLKSLSSQKSCIGAAVSGGADSVSLLVSLCALCKPLSIPVKVITVNHYIRQESETCGDVEYVRTLCQSLCKEGYDVELTVCELEKGLVGSLADKKEIGIEAAARELRYDAFKKFIEEKKLKCLCLAHNKNDQLETLVMRFLQGAGTESRGGIPQVRGKYVRPLLDIERAQIEQYLTQKKISWRNDSTNNDTSYLRNRIRSELVPLLNERFAGWDKAVLTGAQKAMDDAEVLEGRPFDKLRNPKASFYSLPRALKIRTLLEAANKAGFDTRIPYVFLCDVCDSVDCADNYNRRKVEKRFANMCFILDENGVTVKKSDEVQNEIVFSAIIEKSGFYEIPAGQVFVPDGIEFPVLLRSWRSGDEVQKADGGTKKLSDVFSDWHVSASKRQYIPVVQELKTPEQKIICILGSCLGYKDWIVKNEKV
ncbi:MAG: tRNA lysidine(34) synthetase TilS [Treponema sp.]|nr:tRNA lysidine(34) synthetase TilS [Treponema sp.]